MIKAIPAVCKEKIHPTRAEPASGNALRLLWRASYAMLRGMRKFFFTLPVALFCVLTCLPMVTQAEESAGKQFLRGLVRKGAQAVQSKLSEQEPAEQEDAPLPAKPGAALLPAGGLTRAVREVVVESLDAVKEQYMEEGRVYARHLGDKLAERIVQNPKVQSALFMVKALAWVVLLYLTAITLLLLLSLRKLHAGNRRLLELLEQRSRS